MAAIIDGPLNQGAFGTCVGHAFAKAFTSGVLGKYGVALNVEEILYTVKQHGNCWEGSNPEAMCEVWNANLQDTWFDDIDHNCRYRIKVESQRSDSIEQCHAYIKMTQGVLLLIAAIKTDADGHQRHAIAVDMPYQQLNMRGLNSWGASQVYLNVTPENFYYAVTIQPVLLEKKHGATPQPLPCTTRGFNEFEMPNDDTPALYINTPSSYTSTPMPYTGTGIMYGPNITPSSTSTSTGETKENDSQRMINIQYTAQLVDGRILYLAENDGYTKMVVVKNGNSRSKYYQGTIANFDAMSWSTYEKPNPHYLVRNLYPISMYNGTGIMYVSGSQSRTNPQPIEYITQLMDGRTVYLVHDGEYTKIVAVKDGNIDDGSEGKYYVGSIDSFDAMHWNGYKKCENYTVAKLETKINIYAGTGVMYGKSIGENGNGEIRIQRISQLTNGLTVYMIEDGKYTKMVAVKNTNYEDSKAKYYEGEMRNFKAKDWGTYIKQSKGYRVKNL